MERKGQGGGGWGQDRRIGLGTDRMLVRGREGGSEGGKCGREGLGGDWMDGELPGWGAWESVLGSVWDMNGLEGLPGGGGETGLGLRKHN